MNKSKLTAIAVILIVGACSIGQVAADSKTHAEDTEGTFIPIKYEDNKCKEL